MVAGGLIQLVTAVGEQDTYLTKFPEISFFRSVYKRHTNFSIETVEEIFRSSVTFGKQTRCELKKYGDMISNITLYISIGSLNNVKKKFGWTNSIGHALLKSVCLEIDGRQIDKHYGEWLEIWSELTQTYEKRMGYNQMIGKVDFNAYTPNTFTDSLELYIPLNFFFCKNYGSSLPILALYNSKIELIFDFRIFDECWVYIDKKEKTIPQKPNMNAKLLIEYIYLDINERNYILNSSNTYLIEQLHFTGNIEVNSSTGNLPIYFTGIIKELIWVLHRSDVIETSVNSIDTMGNDWFNFSTNSVRNNTNIDVFKTGVIQINGIDLFKEREASFFRLLQPYYKHTRVPSNYIYTYSFSLRPEELQPTGHLNFSMIDNARILLNNVFTQSDKYNSLKYYAAVYGIGYNLFSISDGKGGLLFLNN